MTRTPAMPISSIDPTIIIVVRVNLTGEKAKFLTMALSSSKRTYLVALRKGAHKSATASKDFETG
jgi:hypothetical protein